MDPANIFLNFEVCNITAGGCRFTTTTTATADPPPLTSIPSIPEGNQTVIIVIATLAGVIAIALVIVAILCWKRNHNHMLSRNKNTGKGVLNCSVIVIF